MTETVPALPVRLTQQNIHEATLRAVNGGYEIVTTGGDPYLFTEPLGTPVDARRTMLSFEFFSTTGTNSFQVFLMPPLSEANSVKVTGLAHSEGWSSFAVDVSPIVNKLGGKVQSLRIDFGDNAGKNIQLRNLQLRAPTAQELELAARREAQRDAEKQRDIALRGYLKENYPAQVTSVFVDDKQIKIQGFVSFLRIMNAKPGTDKAAPLAPFTARGNNEPTIKTALPAAGKPPWSLVEVPLWSNVTEMRQFPQVQTLTLTDEGRFSVTVDRWRKDARDPARSYDRLLSRWAVARQDGDAYKLISHARHADAVKAQWDLPEEKPRNKKGLGGITLGHPVSDFDDLGLAAATVNIVLNGLMDMKPGANRTPYQRDGRTYYVNDKFVEGLDKTLLAAAQRKLVVSAIVLIGQPGRASAGTFNRLLAHPDADPAGIFAMPDVSSEEGLEAYATALDYLARRYSRPDAQFGRIHHWIMHNEVNAGWVWTNAGEKTPLLYTDLYHRSMRIAQLIARQYNAHSQAFVSLEHHWLSPNARIYAGREILELLLDFSHAEGDFDWALAFHPYPQNLFEPRVWEDNQVTFNFDTPKITFKNLEVLDAWMKQPRALFNHTKLRSIHLTEQGLNSLDYSEKSLRDQAAGMAYTWNKIKHLDSIQAFDYHNWVDNRGEGGLRIGLRKFPDEPGDPHGKKPIWFVYQALGTDKEEAATAFAKEVIGINDWSEVQYKGKIGP